VGVLPAGLWTAKELIDQGLTVDVVEKSEHLASGATTRNEGWLHAGTYHAAAIISDASRKPLCCVSYRYIRPY
jgi:glycine/D-amino acid oxidase-like deaminating enzyme